MHCSHTPLFQPTYLVHRRLYDVMMSQFRQDPAHYPRPVFRIVVLYVEQSESVTRQLKRGRLSREHNQKVFFFFSWYRWFIQFDQWLMLPIVV